jgi:hypothetical protein
MRLRRQQRGQVLQRAAGALHRGHLDPVPDQHDDDEGRELPVQRRTAHQAERGGQTVGERHRDRQPDERHHAGLPRPQLAHGTGDEQPAAVDVEHDA